MCVCACVSPRMNKIDLVCVLPWLGVIGVVSVNAWGKAQAGSAWCGGEGIPQSVPSEP